MHPKAYILLVRCTRTIEIPVILRLSKLNNNMITNNISNLFWCDGSSIFAIVSIVVKSSVFVLSIGLR